MGHMELEFARGPESLYSFQHGYASAASPVTPHGNFLKGARWSPDGACLATSSDDNLVRIYDLPQDALDCAAQEGGGGEAQPPGQDSFDAALTVHAGETCYDFAWYPGMVATDAASCCFSTSARAHPIHLWDACTGALRCTYRAYDAADEITAAYSLAFSPDAATLWAGYNKTLRVFNVNRPGREYKEVPTLHKKRQEGQGGIISCIGFSPGEAAATLVAAGSYGRTVGIYDPATFEQLYVLHGQKGGVTQVQFSPDGNFLYVGARKDPEILCWDVRYTQETLYRIQRDTAGTNQRVGFDIEPCGRHLASGGEDGAVRVYDLRDGSEVLKYHAGPDCINGFSFNPRVPVAATASGERQFPLAASSDESSGDEAAGGAARGRGKRARREDGGGGGGGGFSNSLRVWRMAYQWVEADGIAEEGAGGGTEEGGLEQ